ncbi:C45 family autoproteolytic acyltransferase/hydolase [Reichenbachiella sp.]|uniref:C45 family autoproteolytic acyltransferase/hydolase n=1 Tax=Reichenbachiella sp. TaxID=2184521 RepID=UPI003B5A1D4C
MKPLRTKFEIIFKKTTLTVFIMVGLINFSYAQEEPIDNIKIPKVEYRGGIYYLELDAETPYKRGYQHGKALNFIINKKIRDFKEWLRENAGITEPDKMIQEFAKNTGHINTVKELVPDLYQEMEGIAKGANVDFNELFLYQSFDELFLFLMKSGSIKFGDGHCTTTGVYGRKNLPNYVTHNNDIPTYHEGAVTVLKIRYPNSDLVILQQTFAGQIGQNGVNNYGVAVGINTIADLPTSDQGIPVSFNVRKILESKNRTKAVDYLNTVHFGTAMNYMIADREKVISVETWKDTVVVVDNYKNNYAVHTNHTLQENAPVAFKMDANMGGGSYGYTFERLELAEKTLKSERNTINFESIKKLKTTRPILVNPGSATGRTLQCMIVEIPKKGNPILFTTPDSPNWFTHVKFEF